MAVDISWAALLALLLVVGVTAAVLIPASILGYRHFSQRRRHGHGERHVRTTTAGLIFALLLIPVSIGLFLFMGVTWLYLARAQETPATTVLHVDKTPTQIASDTHFIALDNQNAPVRPSETPLIDDAAISADKPAADATLSEETAQAPDWVHRPRFDDGKTIIAVIRSKQYQTVAECERDVIAKATQELMADFPKVFGIADTWTIPESFVSSEAIRQRYVERLTRQTEKHTFDVRRMSALLEITPDLRRQVYEIWRGQAVERRLWHLGGLVGLATLILATIASYLRLDARTSGAYRGRLKLAAGLLITVGSLVVVRTLQV